MQTVTSLTIKSDYLENLLWKIRALKGRENAAVADPGSNPTDDEAGIALEDRKEHLDDDEVAREIAGLNDRQQAELVALLWTGQKVTEPEEWEATVQRAMTEVDTPVTDYLLGHPLVAEHVEEGVKLLDIDA